MKLAELFEKLSYGELSNTVVGGEGSGRIPEEYHLKLINYTNAGLLALFSKFILKQKDVLIVQVGHITNYHLKTQYAESSEANSKDIPFPYIKDLPEEKFSADVIKILGVYSNGRQLPLNDKDDPESLFTPQPDILQVPHPQDGEPLSIVYQARHQKLTNGDGYINQEVDIPFFLEDALQNYIAHKVFSHINGQENVVKSQEHLQAFNTSCMEIEQKDLNSGIGHTSHTKLEERGFV